MSPPNPLTDPARLRLLTETELLDSDTEATFDRVAKLAAKLLGVPTALVSLVDDKRQFFKAALGLGEPWATRRGTPLSHSFCQHVVSSGSPLVVEDARTHPLVRDNLAVSELGVVSYLGAPLTTASNHTLGALCVIDTEPREWSDEAIDMLSELARMLVPEIERRIELRQRRASEALYQASFSASEADRRETQEQLRLTLDLAPIGMAVVSLEGRFVVVNRALCETVGYSAEELVQKTFQDLTHPDDLAGDLELVNKLLRREIHRYELTKRYLHKSGRVVDVVIHASLMLSPGGAPLRFIAQIQDVTEARALDRELRQKTAIIGAVLDQMVEGVVVSDAEGLPVLFNPALEAMLGRGAGDGWPDTWPAGFGIFLSDQATLCPPAALPLARALRGEVVNQVELFVRAPKWPDGRWHSTSAHPIHDARGDFIGAVSVGRDVTELVEARRRTSEQASALAFLLSIATAANNAHDAEEAMRGMLEAVASYTGWPVGHVLRREGDGLVSSNLWLGEQVAVGELIAATNAIHYESGIGLPGLTLQAGEVFRMDDVTVDPRFLRRDAARTAGLRGGYGIPVRVGGEVTGVLEFFSTQPLSPDPSLEALLENVGHELGRVLERDDLLRKVASLSITDELTGLHNRRGFVTVAAQLLRMAQRAGNATVLLFADVDGLKEVNDKQGHEAGDALIVEAAKVLRKAFRESDVVARLGGDEFAALASVNSPANAEVMEARLQATLAERAKTATLPLRMSVGVVTAEPNEVVDLGQLLVRADARMYEQKRARKSLRP